VVDSVSRSALSELIEAIALGQKPWRSIYRFRTDSKDRAIAGILAGGGLIRIFSDSTSEFAPPCSEQVLPYVAFLNSDLEYQWPDKPRRPWYDQLGLASSRSWTAKMKVWSEFGEVKYYPFVSRYEHDKWIKMQ
jgi:hypothetical protein